MSFSDTQIRKLQRDVKACDVRTREVNGKELSYIEGWHAIAEANRIFGFDGWSRETIEYRCLVSREKGGSFHVLYMAKIRITVRTESSAILRESFGTGEAQAPTAGEAHDKAIKTAETDATKRAFATFGKPFGLSLYLGGRKRQEAADIQRRRTLQRLGPNGRYYPAPRPRQTLLDTRGFAGSQPNGHNTTGSIDVRDNAEGSKSNSDDQPQPIPGLPLSNDHALPCAVQTEGAAPQDMDDGATSQAVAVHSAPPTMAAARSEKPAKIGESPLLIERPKRRRDPEHLKYISSQPCLICSRIPSDAHHLKFAQPRAISKKVSDEFTVPLCRTHHRQLHHAGNEIAWWLDIDIDPLPIARDLWEQSKARKTDRPHDQ